ncbi:hypothetical protein AXX17_AT3G15660 [Arabidopsis thaliana]|uniref:Uncharacterized protein n=1 Tax=Arabidopsis thaliana TaxID=3702 RepID=A0A178V784_ARATH|nr:hypothetical protein AXX17_AT3G15660 [Arabidopsis thaliana]
MVSSQFHSFSIAQVTSPPAVVEIFFSPLRFQLGALKIRSTKRTKCKGKKKRMVIGKKRVYTSLTMTAF